MTEEETQKIWESLSLIYGRNLQAATIVVLVKTGETSVKFVTTTIPQLEEQ